MKTTDITITWHGHSCFTLTCDDYSVVLDPFSDGTVPGYGPVRETADEVLCSHEHGDHNFRDAVKLRRQGRKNPFIVKELLIPHDDAQGTKRGMNLIRIFDNGRLRVAHFGDIGCPLNEEQKALLQGLDAVLVPVGGYYTMEPDGIAAMLKAIAPRVIVPMHYRSESFGYDVIGTLPDFLKLMDTEATYLEGNSFTLTGEEPSGIIVPAYLGK